MAKTYTIGALARRLGVSTDTLRYYEKRGILTSRRREGSSYRMYDRSDCQQILGALMLRAEAIPLEQVPELMRQCTVDQQLDRLRSRQRELRAEIRRMMDLEDRLREAETLMLQGCKGVDRVVDGIQPAHWAIYTIAGDNGAADEAIPPSWTEGQPYTYYALRLPQDHAFDGSPLELGMGILDKNVSRVRLDMGSAHLTAERPVLGYAYYTEDLTLPPAAGFSAVWEQMQASDLRLAGDVTGRVLCFGCQEGRTRYCVSLGFPVEKNEKAFSTRGLDVDM